MRHCAPLFALVFVASVLAGWGFLCAGVGAAATEMTWRSASEGRDRDVPRDTPPGTAELNDEDDSGQEDDANDALVVELVASSAPVVERRAPFHAHSFDYAAPVLEPTTPPPRS